MDSLEQRIEILQKKKPQTDTLIINKRELSTDSVKQPVANRNNDSLAVINTKDSFTIARKTDSLKKMEYDIKSNNDTMVVMQQSLKEAQDSANYYRRLAFAARSDNKLNLAEDTIVKTDTIQKKRKLFQKNLNRNNDKQQQEGKINITDSSSANPDQHTLIQHSNVESDQKYEERVREIDQQLKDLQTKNEILGRNYDQLKTNMQLQENQSRQRIYEPRVYKDNNYDAEISSLRDEIRRMKDNAASDNRSRNYIPPAITYITPPAATPSRDTVYMAQVPLQKDSSSSNENDEIMQELKALRNQVDSMKKSSLKPTIPTKAEPVIAFEPASYPITSLYFKMGTSSFGKDQDNKIVPFATVATKNPDAILSLTAFTDPVGNVTVNNKLANARLRFVQQLLVVKYKIDASRIMLEEPVLGKGASKPNPMDRRVDIQFK